MYCVQDYRCANDSVTALKRHEVLSKHREAAAQVQKTKNIFEMCQSQASVKTRVNIIEIQLALLIIKKNLPIAASDDLVDFLKTIDIDKVVQKQLKAHRTKTTAVICNVVGKYSFENLLTVLRQKKFSLIIDESTDIVSTKHLILCVRYLNSSGRVCDDFLALLEVFRVPFY